MDDLSIQFLQDGDQPSSVVEALRAFCARATATLDIATYDCALQGEPADAVRALLNACAARGVTVRTAYFAGPHRALPGIRPPVGSSAEFAELLPGDARGITGFAALMHHKYVIRDAGTQNAAVWTGSTNWTVDAWSREENDIVILPSPELAALYHADFEEMWASSRLDDTGARDGGSATLTLGGSPVPVTVWFSPGQGEAMAKEVGAAIAAARTRVVVASPVVTDGPILGALRDTATAGKVPVRGIYDATQMQEVRAQWRALPQPTWKLDALDTLVQHADWAWKWSTPYSPTSVHDYMHLKMIVVDDRVFTGSYNFSHSGEENAENLLLLESAALAERCATFIDGLRQKYGQAPARHH